uniref:Uncharacterized protein n=1 Tax=Anguilla anguilla TaxID=7936 RepID=A0A0E9PRK1_ANGAN
MIQHIQIDSTAMWTINYHHYFH